MTIAEAFLRCYLQLDSTEFSGPELLPVRLMKACASVLPVAGAGLSAFTDDGFRIPLGASDDMSTTAERLQFTVGQGPCIDAHTSSRTVRATDSIIAVRWPMFHQQLVTRTPFRAIAAVPLHDALAAFGSMDLFMRTSQDLAALTTADIDEVTAYVTRILMHHSPTGDTDDGPQWSNGPAATRRSWVFIAIGLLNVALHINQETALALLRAHAFSHDRAVDDVAYDIANRHIPTSALRPDGTG
jgi:hypothetical protein